MQFPQGCYARRTSYPEGTRPEVIRVLEAARASRTRLRITLDYAGSIETERGYIGRTTGTIKAAILIHNRRSMGGGILSTHRIVAIHRSAGGLTLFNSTGDQGA